MIKDNKEQEEIYLRLINKSEDYIEEHLSEAISLSDLAKHANFSEFHFHRLFKEYSTETLKSFITRMKLERAALFLSINQSISLTDVSLNYGYTEGSSFSRAFKNYFGISPSEYRIRARNDKKSY